MIINLFLLLASTYAQRNNRIKQPQTKTLRELVIDADYMAHLNQSILFQYTNYHGAFDIELTQQKYGENISIPEADSFNPDIVQGCRPYGRKIVQNQLFNKTLFLDSETEATMKGIITSVYAANQFVFVLRSDFQLFIIEIKYNIQDREIKSFDQSKVIDLSEIFERKDENHFINDGELECSQYLKEGSTVTCYILSKEGIIQFQFSQSENQMKKIQKLDIFRDEVVTDTFLDDQISLLLVTFEYVGVYVYSIVPDGSLNLIDVLKPNQQMQLKQAKVSEGGEYIYVLDERIGIFIYDVDVLKKNITFHNFYITLKGGQTFDFYLNTMFVVARTEDDLPYALEIFLNFQTQSYYFNSIYQYGQDIYDVFVGYSFALFVGNELHQVVHHSVYNKFENNQEQFYFSDIDLIAVDELQPPWKKQILQSQAFELGIFKDVDMAFTQSYLVGVSEKEVSLITLRSVPPWVFCSALEETKEFYQLKIRSTNCLIKQIREANQFVECEILANFTFSGQPIYLFEEDYTLMVVVIIVLVIAILALIILILLCKKSWYVELNDIDEKQLEEYSRRELNRVESQRITTTMFG